MPFQYLGGGFFAAFGRRGEGLREAEAGLGKGREGKVGQMGLLIFISTDKSIVIILCSFTYSLILIP